MKLYTIIVMTLSKHMIIVILHFGVKNVVFEQKLFHLSKLLVFYRNTFKQNRSTEGCSKLKRSVDMTTSGKNGLNIRTNASPKWDRTRCPEE